MESELLYAYLPESILGPRGDPRKKLRKGRTGIEKLFSNKITKEKQSIDAQREAIARIRDLGMRATFVQMDKEKPYSIEDLAQSRVFAEYSIQVMGWSQIASRTFYNTNEPSVILVEDHETYENATIGQVLTLISDVEESDREAIKSKVKSFREKQKTS